jgi:tight adherence protein B
VREAAARLQRLPGLRQLLDRGRRASLEPLTARAESFRGLASLLRAGLPVRAAVVSWAKESSPLVRAGPERAARRLRLGDSVEEALDHLELEFGDDARSLSVVMELGYRLGGDIPGVIDDLAATIDRRRAMLQASAASVAGARLSARMVAALPLLCAPLLPASRARLLDGHGLIIVLVGLALALAGMRWMARLVPAPPLSDDGAATLATVVSAGMGAGASLRVALDLASTQAPDDLAGECLKAHRLVRLGSTWPEALSRSDDEALQVLGRTVAAADSRGLPVADALRVFADRRRAERERSLQRDLHRAPVLMVIPLAVCVLPSFIILGIGPFLRGLALS